MSSHEQVEALLDFVANPAEGAELLLWRCIGRIVEAPMDGFGAGKDGAVFFGAVADSDHKVELLTDEGIHIF